MFYIIEKSEQLEKLKPIGDCFINFIPFSDNFHPKLSPLSLIYIHGLKDHKGYILCIEHNESFCLSQQNVEEWILKNTGNIFVLDKKEALYWFNHPDKLYDIDFIERVDFVTNNVEVPAISYYYSTHTNYPTVNKIIPISKHYEESEKMFNVILPVIHKYRAEDAVYAFNNGPLTRVFHEIESQGIKIDRQCFIDCYDESLKYPEFNISKGKIYSQYNLYTTTGRPSNSYNSINFAALNKNNGERLCYKPENDMFVEYDIQGYHPRLIGELIDFHFPKDKTTYEYLATLLNVTVEEAKELTFKQLYGGIWNEYINKSFFKDIGTFIDGMWDTYQYGGYYETTNKRFRDLEDITPAKLLNYVVQSQETSTNVTMLEKILDYLKDKKTKLVLYTYDAFLFDYSKEDGKQLLTELKDMIKYPINIKQGNTYHGLEKL
jgi:hypothetical protein